MQSIEQLIQSIDGHIRELKGEITSLQDARAALVANGSAPTRAPKPRQRPPARQQPAKAAALSTPRRKTKVLTAEATERMLAESDGLTTSALAERAGADRDQVLALLRDLEAASRIRRTGQRRATRWHAITDEDRISKRAAELAARSRPRGRLIPISPESDTSFALAP